jgi:hypothetical protein
MTMKKARARSSAKKPRELAREYRLDYTKARPNRFANRMKANSVTVVLDPDVASVFKSSEAVNELLRSVMSAMSSR